jgi:diguanylate cyclase (GGDEF)-like protein/PAS domain S-box-containing protein
MTDPLRTYRQALDAATSGILVMDARHVVVHVNRAFEELFGWTRHELIGREAGMLGTSVPEVARGAMGDAVRDGRAHRTTITGYRRDGSAFRAHVALTPAHGDDGALTSWIAVVDDVSTLADAEARYRGLVEQIPAVVFICDWDAEGELHYVSPQIEQVMGWTPEELLSNQDLWYASIHPDDLDRYRAEERRAWATGDMFDCEYRTIARDGRELWIWERDALIASAEGAPRLGQGVLVDITSLRRTETALREERDRAQQYLDVAGAVIVVLDADERIALVNRAGHELLGYEDGELLGRNWFDVVAPAAEREERRAAFAEALATAGPNAAMVENVVLTRDGERRVLAWQETVLRDGEGRGTALLSSGVDLTERRAAEQQIAYLAYHDSLTGLPNRALLQEHLDIALARARRNGHGVALLYLDLDGFKLVNDSLGHPAGDELLCQVAMRLAERRRDMDLLARQGGDEFLLLLTDLDRAQAEATARRVAAGLQQALAQPFTISGAEFHVGASIGVSLHPRDAADADQLLRHADAAMYDAKSAGRNGITVYDGDPQEPLERLSMTSRLRKALARDEFVVHWQPIVDPRDGALHKVEALVRWDDPFRGLVPPGEFIGFAEDTGLIDRIGEWVADAVRKQVLAWEHDGFAAPRITLNVSPRQLRRPDFGDRLLHALGPEAVASGITVEITESAAMADPARTDPVLRRLHQAGVEIAVDDFGAGYSSLTRLRTMPVQVLKIDRTFLQAVPEDPEATAIVTAMIELARALGMEAVAEGVETDAQRRFLIALGCPLAQGFLLGRPVPAAELESRLRRSAAGRRAVAS